MEASPEVLNRAYRTLVQKYHPDRFHVSDKSLLEARMKTLNDAYHTLSDPKRRQHYNAQYQEFLRAKPRLEVREALSQNTRKLLYWFALTIFLVIAGRAFLNTLAMLPFVLKLGLVVGVIWLAKSVFEKRFGKKKQ